MAHSHCFDALATPHSAFSHVPEHGFSLFLANRTKTIHFVRHAEGEHNVAVREAGSELPTVWSSEGSEQYEDASLTATGREQSLEVRAHTADKLPVELVVVSPFKRTMQTAHLMFGDRDSRPPFLVHELCRERAGLYTNDRRRPWSVMQAEFAPIFGAESIDFESGLDTDEDSLWTEERETDKACEQRGIDFLQWLMAREEREIAVVTHSSFLRHIFGQFGCDLSPGDRSVLQRGAGNAEVRSITLASHKDSSPK